MIFETKFDIGYMFWTPRTRQRTVYMMRIDEDGTEWSSRKKDGLEPYVKQKTIVGIDILTMNQKILMRYRVREPEFDLLPQYYNEEDLVKMLRFETEEEAMRAAKQMAEEGKEYHG